MVYEYTKLIKKFEKSLSKRKMTIDLYKEMCQLFELYNILKYNVIDENFFEIDSMKLIRNVVYTFQINLDIEELLHVYPMELKRHLNFYLINELNDQDNKLNLLIKLFKKEYIQNNEWIDLEWNVISEMYLHCIEGFNFPVTFLNKSVEEYLLDIRQEASYASFLQQLWINSILEEVDEKRRSK